MGVRLTGDGLRRSLAFRNSLHQTDLVDTLVSCGMVSHHREAVVVGTEPEDYQSMGVSLSTSIAGCLETITEAVAEEVRSFGGTLTRKKHSMR
jgi:hydrogenase maturation protease